MSSANSDQPLHVISRPKGWGVVARSASKASSIHPTKAQAVTAARAIKGRPGRLIVVHNKDGTVSRVFKTSADPGSLLKRPASERLRKTAAATLS